MSKQLAMIFLIAIGVLLVILFRKQIFKMIVVIVCLATLLVCVNTLYPEKVKIVGGYIQNIREVSKIADKSDNIKLELSKDKKLKPENIKVKIKKKWYSVNDIKKIEKDVKSDDYVATIGKDKLKVTDKYIIKIVKFMPK